MLHCIIISHSTELLVKCTLHMYTGADHTRKIKTGEGVGQEDVGQ